MYFAYFERKQRINPLYSGKLESRGIQFKFINKRTNNDFIISTTEANFLAFNQKLRMLAAATAAWPSIAYDALDGSRLVQRCRPIVCPKHEIDILLIFSLRDASRMEINQIRVAPEKSERKWMGETGAFYIRMNFNAI